MSEEETYDLKPEEKKPAPPPGPKPGEPGWVEPVPIIEKADAPEEPPEPPRDEDAEKNKAMGILAYILFIIPLVAAPQSKFARFHANQGLLLFITWWILVIAVTLMHFAKILLAHVFADIGILESFFSCIIFLLQPAILISGLVLTVMGIVHAANGEKKELPLIGHWTLLK